jgi:hypothetical protein
MRKVNRNYAAAVIFSGAVAWILTATPLLSQINIPGVTQHGAVTAGHCVSWFGTEQVQDAGGACGSGFANPTAVAGPVAINGSASSGMRSDAAPAIQKGSNAQFGIVESDGTTITCTTGLCVVAATTFGGQSVSPGASATVQGNGGKIQLSTGTTTTGDCVKYDANGNTIDAATGCAVGGNPTATAGPSAVNGSSAAFMRADAAPAVQLGSAAQAGLILCGTGTTCSGGTMTVSGASGGNPTATAGPVAINGSSVAFMRSDGAPAVQKGTNAQFGIVESDGTTITCTSGVCVVAATTFGGQSVSPGGSAAVQGNGAKVQLSTGSATTNDCVKFDANGNTVDSGSGCAGGALSPIAGRLTLQSGHPVMNTTQANKSTLFFDTFGFPNASVPVYNGSSDVELTITSNEISDVLQTSGTGVTNGNGVFDEWAVNVSGTLTLCHATNGSGGGWASDTGGSNTARGSGYSALNYTTRSYVTNNGTITHCYNGSTDEGPISANQATHLSTWCTTASAGVTTWVLGASAAGGTAAVLCVWNRYNQVPISTFVQDSSASHNYGTNTVRNYDNSATMRVTYVYGENWAMADAQFGAGCSAADNGTTSTPNCSVGIGYNSTSTFAAGQKIGVMPGAGNGGGIAFASDMYAHYSGQLGLGLNFFQVLENSPAANTSTFIGGNSNQQNALIVQLSM